MNNRHSLQNKIGNGNQHALVIRASIADLLAKGQNILSQYFPGIFEQLIQNRVVSFNGADCRLRLVSL